MGVLLWENRTSVRNGFYKSNQGFARRSRRAQREHKGKCLIKNKKSSSHRGHGRNRHRGVSAPSFCDGAIPRFSFVPKIKKTGFAQRTRRALLGTPTFKLACVRFLGKHRGVSDPSFCDGAIPQFSFVPKIKKTGFAQRTQRTRRGHKEKKLD